MISSDVSVGQVKPEEGEMRGETEGLALWPLSIAQGRGVGVRVLLGFVFTQKTAVQAVLYSQAIAGQTLYTDYIKFQIKILILIRRVKCDGGHSPQKLVLFFCGFTAAAIFDCQIKSCLCFN